MTLYHAKTPLRFEIEAILLPPSAAVHQTLANNTEREINPAS
jgi:hypothetical protein